MKTYDLGVNKVLEWVQLMLNPQFTAPEGSMLTPPSDEPGLVREFDPTAAAARVLGPTASALAHGEGVVALT